MYRVEDNVEPRKKVEFRFGVRDSCGNISPTYNLSGRLPSGNNGIVEIYLVPRGTSGLLKVSLHASGARHSSVPSERFSLATTMSPSGSRHLMKWRGFPFLRGEGSDITAEFAIDIPTDYLTPPKDGKESLYNGVTWIDAPPLGHTKNIIILTAHPPGPFMLPEKPTFVDRVADGRYLLVLAETAPFNRPSITGAEKEDYRRRLRGYVRRPEPYSRGIIPFQETFPLNVASWLDLSTRGVLNLIEAPSD